MIQAISQSADLGTSAEISNEGLQAMFMRLVVCNGLLERVQWVRLHSLCLTIVQGGYADESVEQPRSELDTLRQIQDLMVKPALKVPVPQVCETALTCLGLLALESEVCFPLYSAAGYENSSQSDSVSRPESGYSMYRRDEEPHAFQRNAEDRVGPGNGPSVSSWPYIPSARARKTGRGALRLSLLLTADLWCGHG